LFVKKHEVNLVNKKTNKEYKIIENHPFDLETFSFIALQKFIINAKDKAWEDINRVLDKEFYKNLQESLSKKIPEFVIENIKTT
jgi:hypothetical protein